jgi:hypothetical protein
MPRLPLSCQLRTVDPRALAHPPLLHALPPLPLGRRNGGGICVDAGTLSVAGDLALAGNMAAVSGGGAFLSADAVLTCPAAASLTVSGNRADFGGGWGAPREG